MANVKNGTLTPPNDWADHLRPYGKRRFWKRERRAADRDAGYRAMDEHSHRTDD